METSNGVVLPIILGVLTILGGTGFWGFWQSRKDAPVKKRDADLAAAEKSQQMAQSIADDLREDHIRLRDDLKTERGERKKLEGRFEALERHIREQERTIRIIRDVAMELSTAWDHLEENWANLRLLATPPAKPRPLSRAEWQDLVEGVHRDSV